MHILHNLRHHARQFIADVRNDRYERTSDGGIIIANGPKLIGIHREGIIGQPDGWRSHKNLIPAEGILKILGIVFFTDAKINTWYLAPFAASTAPAADLTAANFTSTQTEITSTSEGYSETNRQTWVSAQPAAGKVTNHASPAIFTIVTATALHIKGSALLSAQARGATSGVLASCVKYDTERIVNNGDLWGNEYEVTLTDS